jgi:hypothetical protein
MSRSLPEQQSHQPVRRCQPLFARRCRRCQPRLVRPFRRCQPPFYPKVPTTCRSKVPTTFLPEGANHLSLEGANHFFTRRCQPLVARRCQPLFFPKVSTTFVPPRTLGQTMPSTRENVSWCTGKHHQRSRHEAAARFHLHSVPTKCDTWTVSYA